MRKFVDAISATCFKIEQAYQERMEQHSSLAKTSWQLLEVLPLKLLQRIARQRLVIIYRKERVAEKEIERYLITFRKQLNYYGLADSEMVYFDIYDALRIVVKKRGVVANSYLKMRRKILLNIFEKRLFKELGCSVIPYRFWKIAGQFFKKDLTYQKIIQRMIKLEQQVCSYGGSYY